MSDLSINTSITVTPSFSVTAGNNPLIDTSFSAIVTLNDGVCDVYSIGLCCPSGGFVYDDVLGLSGSLSSTFTPPLYDYLTFGQESDCNIGECCDRPDYIQSGSGGQLPQLTGSFIINERTDTYIPTNSQIDTTINGDVSLTDYQLDNYNIGSCCPSGGFVYDGALGLSGSFELTLVPVDYELVFGGHYDVGDYNIGDCCNNGGYRQLGKTYLEPPVGLINVVFDESIQPVYITIDNQYGLDVTGSFDAEFAPVYPLTISHEIDVTGHFDLYMIPELTISREIGLTGEILVTGECLTSFEVEIGVTCGLNLYIPFSSRFDGDVGVTGEILLDSYDTGIVIDCVGVDSGLGVFGAVHLSGFSWEQLSYQFTTVCDNTSDGRAVNDDQCSNQQNAIAVNDDQCSDQNEATKITTNKCENQNEALELYDYNCFNNSTAIKLTTNKCENQNEALPTHDNSCFNNHTAIKLTTNQCENNKNALPTHNDQCFRSNLECNIDYSYIKGAYNLSQTTYPQQSNTYIQNHASDCCTDFDIGVTQYDYAVYSSSCYVIASQCGNGGYTEGLTKTQCITVHNSRTPNQGLCEILPYNPTPPPIIHDNNRETYTYPTGVSIIMNNEISAKLDDGTDIPFDDLNLNYSPSNVGWVASGTITDGATIDLLKPDPTTGEPVKITIVINSVTWYVWVSEISMSRSFVAKSASVSMIGINKELVRPFATELDYSQSTTMTPQQIALDMLDGTDWVLHWNIVDWVLPPNTYKSTGKTRFEILADVVKKCYGRIYMSTDSKDIYVYPEYPVSPFNYASTAPDLILDETVIKSLTEKRFAKNDMNGVIVSGSQPSGAFGKTLLYGTSGDILAPDYHNEFAIDAASVRYFGEQVINGYNFPDKFSKIVIPFNGSTYPLVKTSDIVKLRVSKFEDGTYDGDGAPLEDVYEVANSIAISTNFEEVWQTVTFGKTDGNLFSQFNALMPKSVTKIGQVTSTDGYSSQVTLVGGANIVVDGSEPINSWVKIEDGRIKDKLPSLTSIADYTYG